MKTSKLPSLLDKCWELRHVPYGQRSKHFSFILYRNRIVSLGWNQKKTHPLAHKYGYEYPYIHSELHSILNFNGSLADLESCELVNIRINRKGKALLSKPCKDCKRLLRSFVFKNVFYTDNEGKLKCL